MSSVLGSLRCVDMASVVDVSQIYAASFFSVEMSKEGVSNVETTMSGLSVGNRP
jgi:hypothetical protein